MRDPVCCPPGSLITGESTLPSARKGDTMQGFFTEPNLTRYKKLASDSLTVVERRAILDFLAAELAKQRCLGMAKGCGTD